MVLGFLLMGLLALGTIASIAWPLWRASSDTGLKAEDSNLAVWRQEREEILRDAENGSMSATERDAALAELSDRAAREMALPGREPRMPKRPARVLAILLGAGILVLSVVLYGRLGRMDALSGNVPLAADAGSGSLGPQDPRVIAMVEALSSKLKTKPDDLEGWMLLGRSEMVLERFTEAAQAYQHALELSPPNAQLLADAADALAMAQGRSLEGKPAELVMQAVKLDPTNLKALELAGTVAYSHGDTAAAIGYWEKLRKLLPADSDDAREVDAALASLKGGAGAPAATADSGGAQGQQGQQGQQSKQAQQVPENRGEPVAASGPTIAGKVDIQPALAGKVALTDTVYVFARAKPAAGGAPRMPLAVLKFSARELPRAFELGDADAMVPNQKISGQPEVVIQARVSKSGQPLPQPGDIESPPLTVKPGSHGLSLVIGQVVQ